MPIRWNAPGAGPNPLVQVLSLLAAGVLLVGAVLMGAIVIAVLIGIGSIIAVIIYLRFLWLRHKLKRGSKQTGAKDSAGGRVIEVEYTVIDERKPESPGD